MALPDISNERTRSCLLGCLLRVLQGLYLDQLPLQQALEWVLQ